MHKLVVACLVLGIWCIDWGSSLSNQPKDRDKTSRPKNIIFIIGDGMGLSQISALHYMQGMQSNFTQFPVVGLIEVSAVNRKITDSAAGATAFATGKKTYPGAVGVGPDSTQSQSILEIAKELGKRTGIIATSSITHATPAAFYAHKVNRSMEEEIALDLLESKIDFFAAGGSRFFCQREDDQDLIQGFTDIGYCIDTAELRTPDTDCEKVGYLLAKRGLPRAQRRDSFLVDATSLAIDHLNLGEKGFLMIIEGSQIDWAGHANDSAWLLSEMQDFDRLLESVMAFAVMDQQTLVVVTADHETGGLALTDTDRNYDQLSLKFSSGSHTADLIPLFAYGPGSSMFSGFYTNDGVFTRLRLAIRE